MATLHMAAPWSRYATSLVYRGPRRNGCGPSSSGGQARVRRRIPPTAALVATATAIACAGCGSGSGHSGVTTRFGLSPAPGTPVASPQTQISIRGATASEIESVTVTGSRSGAHPGRLVDYDAVVGASFLPARPFDPGETVNVSLLVRGSRQPVRYHFEIARKLPLEVRAGPPGKPSRPDQVQSFHSRPDLRPPAVTVETQSTAAAPGDIFLGPANKLGQAGPLILDGHGRMVWFDPLPGKTQAFDFREQPYQGKPALTWWQGIVTTRGFGDGEDVIYNRHYKRIATVRAGNGYRADLHDFVITPLGTALVLAYDPVRMDLRAFGGPRDGTVLDGVVQEIDTRTGLVIFEWHSVGHVSLDESYSKPAKDGLFDYFHINSVAVDSDGNLLISARNTRAVYKVNHRTGQIMWRLNGKRSSFAIGAGVSFAYQHDARPHPGGVISLFDNGASPKVHSQSRGIALRLDSRTMTATLVDEWTYPGGLLADSQGNMQALPNGNRLIGWGSKPNLTEFTPGGRIVFDARLAAPDTSYRAFRLPWTATPPGRPAIAATTAPGHRATVYMSWNGATDISRWRILAGAGTRSLRPIAEVPRSGFETEAIVFTSAARIEAEALSASGRKIGTSAAIEPARSR